MTVQQQLKQSIEILSKPIISQEDINEVKRIISDALFLLVFDID